MKTLNCSINQLKEAFAAYTIHRINSPTSYDVIRDEWLSFWSYCMRQGIMAEERKIDKKGVSDEKVV